MKKAVCVNYGSPLGVLTLQSDGEYLTGVCFGGCECEREDKTAASKTIYS